MSITDLALEQEYISLLYDHVDELRARLAARQTRALASATGTRQALVEREAAVHLYGARLTQLNAAENALCFGRLDLEGNGRPRYVGRIGLHEDHAEPAAGADDTTGADDEPLLIDWRAPVARPFYLATALQRDGVVRRRHIRTVGRRVVQLHDEHLTGDASTSPAAQTGPGSITSESALLTALNAARTGRMTDIVETVQAEQDRIIRSGLPGILVVQGGPGTGKTAVALHRAAYLLYHHREQLERRGVLIIGPNTTFLRYIAEVLPALGETGVLLATTGDLYPGVSPTLTEPGAVTALKGQLLMADVVAGAVADRQWVPQDDEVVAVRHDGQLLRLDRQTGQELRERVRASRLLHNEARPLVRRLVVEALAEQWAQAVGTDPLGGENLLGPEDLALVRGELEENDDVGSIVDWLWPRLTPTRLLRDLFSSPQRLRAAATQVGLTRAEQELLLRPRGSGWSEADVPLLDEAAEILGRDDSTTRRLADELQTADLEYAQGVLDVLRGSESGDFEDEESEILAAFDLVDAETLLDRQEEIDHRTAAERAAIDRTWRFGHIVVDEAQEISPMAWRMLMRRSRSMTLVGDVAQTGDPAGSTSWRQALGPHVGDRWRLTELSVNYRMPQPIARVAAGVLRAVDPDLPAPEPVRTDGPQPWALHRPDVLPGLVVAVADELTHLDQDRRLAVVTAPGRAAEAFRALTGALAGTVALGEDPDTENIARVVVLEPRETKGLEFDAVVVLEPDHIVAASPRGLGDLYVAVTRATQRLGVVYSASLPKCLDSLA
ncbi:AAA family ATPase [Kineosporia sp. NBRC 101731]|uniref:AAA family ATPase n=1 Tax=Kineosporia sp. NBRC 101731 TaxID=3032199 RepID=UPI0024A2F65C|nr:AAA family ATPase [Kineosporia sp. NBRC 101731]GLY31767.1 DNA helicase [Kineosporia sp. NBRC 101731]